MSMSRNYKTIVSTFTTFVLIFLLPIGTFASSYYKYNDPKARYIIQFRCEQSEKIKVIKSDDKVKCDYHFY